MAFFSSRFAAGTAIIVALAMAATPAAAARLPLPERAVAPVPAAKGWSVDDETAERHRGYRGYRGGWGRHRHHHGDGIDAGDVLAGVLIIGGIAAIASAASKNERDRDNEPYREPEPRYRGDDRGSSGYESGGLDRAADMCVREVERSEPVETVDSVERSGEGWEVEGRLRSGGGFTCRIDNNGRVGPVDLGGRASASEPQWDDSAYARARAERETERDVEL